jgi:hypothetical protein
MSITDIGIGQRLTSLVSCLVSLTWNFSSLNLFAAAAQYSAYTRCLDTLKKRETNFRSFEARMSRENVQKWQAMDDCPHMENGKVVSVHAAKFKNSKGVVHYPLYLIKHFMECTAGPPTQDKAYKSLLLQELENKSSPNKSVGRIQFVNDGLRLERDQCVYDSPLAKPCILRNV